MFAYIRVGSSKSVFPRELENDLAYSSNLMARGVCLYICSLYCLEWTERRIKRKVSVEAESLRENVEFGSREPIRFCICSGKAWKRIFVDCELEFCITFVLVRGLCLFVEKSFVEKSLQRINPNFHLNQL